MAKKSLPNLGYNPPPLQTPLTAETPDMQGVPYQQRGGPPRAQVHQAWGTFHANTYQQICLTKFSRTILLNNLAVANPCANVITVHQIGWGTRLTAILTSTISADLTVVFTKGSDIMTITVPHGTAINTPVIVPIAGILFQDQEVIVPKITASGGDTAALPIVAVTVEWNLVQSQSINQTPPTGDQN